MKRTTEILGSFLRRRALRVCSAVLALGAASLSLQAHGQPAARVGDQTTTPRVNGPTPCVGGPITSGSATVLIESLPAARVTDQASSACGPNLIRSGSSTVLINSLPAARTGDALDDGGVIVGGAGSVMIGG